jgi:uncharacterized protein YggU (UPF0235/DUF167 family)
MGEPRPWRAAADGLTVFLRVSPNAGADRIDGEDRRDDGSAVLRLAVKAAPDRGAANAAALGLLARALGVPKSAATLLRGKTARLKTLHVRGDPAALAAAMERLCRAPDRISPENRAKPGASQQNALHKQM